MDALTLLSGDPQVFKEKVWGSRVHLHRGDPAPLVGLLDLDDVDRLLTGSALRTPALRVAKDGRVLPTSRFTRRATMAGEPVTGLVDGRKALELFDDGATLVLQGLHRYWEPLTTLVRRLELELGHPCQANAYLTPPGAQGFARHHDSHDVFVFQTHGRKQWEVVDDPAAGDEAPAREVLLEPGLSMYLPTGTPHSARSQEETSLHVTVGINRLTWRSVLTDLTSELLADEDEPLPAGWLDEPELLHGRLADRLTAYAERLRGLDPAATVDRQRESFLRGRTPALRGGLVDRVHLGTIDDTTVVERRPTATCALRTRPDGALAVLLGDRELRMPGRLRAPMELVRDHTRFQVADLEPWLDPESRLVVVRRLVREGLLRIAR